MSSVVIAGNTSGSITLSAPATAGSNTITLPAETGTLVTTATSTGISGSAITTGTVAVSVGGSGRTTNVAYSVICGGTTTGGVEQSVASVGTSGQVLTSGGAGTLPTWTTISTTPPTTLYDIGTYVIARPANYTNYAPNDTIAGSSLNGTSANVYYTSATWLSYNANSGAQVTNSTDNVGTGTWRSMSRAYGNGTNTGNLGLWVRIS